MSTTTPRVLSAKRKTIALRGLAIAALAAGSLGLTGCSLLNQFLPTAAPARDAQSGEVVEREDNADVFSLRVGDCVNTDDSPDQLSGVPVVPCGEPHPDEVYYSFDLESGSFPGAASVSESADATCYEQFESFIGISYEESVIDFFAIYPSEGSWDEGDREVLCLVYEPGVQTVGSLAGVAR